jgi:hypothetical protein
MSLGAPVYRVPLLAHLVTNSYGRQITQDFRDSIWLIRSNQYGRSVRIFGNRSRQTDFSNPVLDLAKLDSMIAQASL